MKTLFAVLLAVVAAATLQAQAPAPAEKTLLQQLQEIKENNVKMLEHNASTLKRMEELEKTSQSLKMMGKRS